MATRSFCSKCAQYVEAGGACPSCGEATLAVSALASGAAAIPSSAVRRPASDQLVRSCFVTEAELDGGRPGALAAPFSVVRAPDGTLLVLDGGPAGVRLLRLSPQGALLAVIAELASLSQPYGLARGPDGRLYIPEAGADRIAIFSAEGRPAGELKPTEPHPLAFPKDVDLDPEGRAYIADSFNNRVIRLDPAGRCDLVLGTGADLDDDGYLDAGTHPGELDEPAGVTSGPEGRIYVADTNNHRVQVFTREGAPALCLGSEGDDLGRFRFPSDVRVGPTGSIYVADRGNTRIQQFSPRGDLEAYFVPDASAAAPDQSIGDVDVGPSGEVYVPLPARGVIVRGRIARPA